MKFNKSGFNRHGSSRKGSALAIVVILTGCLLATLGTLLSWSITEKKVNSRQALWLEAKNAAESAVEYGFSDLVMRLRNQVNFPIDELVSRPLTLPASYTSFFSNSNIDVSQVELIGGAIPNSSQLVYIDPDDPNNAADPMKRKRARIFEISVYGKARANAGTFGDNIDAYCMQILQVRDSALFSHAIFYNSDLEIHPGPQMDMRGPVHTNRNLYVLSRNSVNFHAGLTAMGEAFRLYKLTKDNTEGNNDPFTGSVNIVEGSTTTLSDWPASKHSANTTSLEKDSTWEAYASTRWKSNVQTSAHGVRSLNPVGIEDYVPENYSTAGTELQNHGYSLIEPQLGTSTTYDKDSKGADIEKQKLSAQAGLIIRVKDDFSGATLHYYETSNPNVPVSKDNTPVADATQGNAPKEISLPATVVSNLVGSNKAIDVQGYEVDGSGNVTKGLYDRREGFRSGTENYNDGGMKTVKIDMQKLRKVLDDTAPGYTSDSDGKAVWNGEYTPEKNFSGVVYVEFDMPVNRGSTSHTSRTDKVRAANSNQAVLIVNGSSIPNPAYNNATGRTPGFTLATNGAAYIQGHYNADGNISSDSASKADNTSEVPAAIIADAVTVLSNNFNTMDSRKKAVADQKMGASSTEVSAAIITGLVPTVSRSEVSNSQQGSGGAHNLIRFLENWGGQTLAYRGSLVALYDSEVAKGAWWRNKFGKWYDPPARTWGFHEYLAQGKFPPGTPFIRDFRRVDFQDITQAEYAAVKANPLNP